MNAEQLSTQSQLDFLKENGISNITDVQIAGKGTYAEVYSIKSDDREFALKVSKRVETSEYEAVALESWRKAGVNCVEVLASRKISDEEFLILMPLIRAPRLLEIFKADESSKRIEPHLEEMAKQQALMHRVKGEGYGSPTEIVTKGESETLNEALNKTLLRKILSGLEELGLIDEYQAHIDVALNRYNEFDQSPVLCHSDYSLHHIFLVESGLLVIDPRPQVLPAYIDVAQTYASFVIDELLGKSLGERYIEFYNRYADQPVSMNAINNHLQLFLLYKMQKWYRRDNTVHGEKLAKRVKNIIDENLA